MLCIYVKVNAPAVFISLRLQLIHLHPLHLALQITASTDTECCNSCVLLKFENFNPYMLIGDRAKQCPLGRGRVAASPCQIAP